MVDHFEVAREWGGILRPLEFVAPKPLLPSATVAFLHYAGLPKRFEITTYQTICFEFLTTAENLAVVWERQMKDYSLPVHWKGLWRIGDITYTQAAAWLCIKELSGRVVAVDVDINDPLYPVNGAVDSLVQCMKRVYDWARPARGSIARAGNFQELIALTPALPAGEFEYFWQPLIAEAIDSGCDELVVEYE